MPYAKFRIRLTTAVGLAICLVAVAAWAAPAADVKARQVIAEFEVAPDGDFLRVPVTIGQEIYPFLVNTGNATTTIDDSLRQKYDLEKIKVEVRGRRGGVVRDRFGGLTARLGNLPLEFPLGVESGDFAGMRENLDIEVLGEIGIDVLGQYIVQIDFDEGILRFLSSLPPSPGEAIRITPLGGEGGAPTIPVILPGRPADKFIVATGRGGHSLEIRSEILGQLEEKKQVTIFDKEKGVTRSGNLLYETGRVESVQIGKFRHSGILVNSAEQNVVGLAYLARYIVTFDFPRSKMYLKKGKSLDAPDSRFSLWNVGIAREGEKVVVREVHGYGPAHQIGLKSGDVVESINNCDVKRLSNWQVRRLLGREGRSLSVVVLRGNEKRTLETESAAGKQ